ncbi:hypothetical protein Q9966_011878 [Columba livia]|nr:hypothetical protein Q9966_011878 [Columba livia]
MPVPAQACDIGSVIVISCDSGLQICPWSKLLLFLTAASPSFIQFTFPLNTKHMQAGFLHYCTDLLLLHDPLQLHAGLFFQVIIPIASPVIWVSRNARESSSGDERWQDMELQTLCLQAEVIQVKEEPDFAFRSEENMLENMSHEGDVAQGYSIPRNPPNPKSPPWKIQMKKEPEPPTDDIANITAIACQKLYIKEEPPENLDYGKLFDPKIPLMALQGRQIKKEEDADGQHEWEEPIAVNHVLHVKEEPRENIEFGMHYGQKPNLSAMQRIQIKEEPSVETSHQKNQSPKRKQKKTWCIPVVSCSDRYCLLVIVTLQTGAHQWGMSSRAGNKDKVLFMFTPCKSILKPHISSPMPCFSGHEKTRFNKQEVEMVEKIQNI